jgi:hypothetical protein
MLLLVIIRYSHGGQDGTSPLTRVQASWISGYLDIKSVINFLLAVVLTIVGSSVLTSIKIVTIYSITSQCRFQLMLSTLDLIPRIIEPAHRIPYLLILLPILSQT